MIAAFVYCVFIGANQWSGIHKKALSVAVGKKNYSTTDEVLPRTPEERLETLESFEVARAAGGNTSRVLKFISEIICNMPVEIAPEDKKAKDVLLGLLNKLRARFDSRRLSNSQLSNEDKAKIHYTEAELELRLGMLSDFGKSLDRLRELGVNGGGLLAKCLNQVCFKYLSPENVDQEMRYIDTYYSPNIANEDLVAHLISLAGNLQYSHHEKCVQYLNSATNYFCTTKVVASFNLYLELTSLLEKLKRPENTVRLSQCIAIPEPAKDEVHARISCDYARALLETDNLQNGERLYRQLSANKSFMAFSGIAEEFEYLRLLYAIKSKNKELRAASLARIVKQLQDKKSKFTEPAGQFFSLFLADPELLDSLQTNLKPPRTAHPELLANEVTEYAHHLRIHGQQVKAISAYKFAHQLYECSPAYIAGNVSAYVGESNCLQTLGRLKESANCYVEAQAYLNSRGHMAADEQPELTSQHAVLLRELGRFDEAIAMHRRVLENLFATRHDRPALFAATAYELLVDYKKAKMKTEAKRTAAVYLPLLEADRAEAPGELKGFKDECSDL